MQNRAHFVSIEELRDRIERVSSVRRQKSVLPFGMGPIDQHLPGGGLALGALHEVAGGGNGALDGAAAALFVAGIAARTTGRVLWCVTRQDLFMPGLVQAGLSQNRVLIVECRDEKGVLDCFEEGLRCNGLGAVVGEVARLTMTASRRLQLAAEASGVIGIAIRRWRRQAEASDYGRPTAAVTRWRISILPSEPLPVPGIGRARWYLELLRCRAAESADYVVEACDAKGRLGLPANLANRSPSQDAWTASAAR
ncbi:damage-inducible protein [Neorhizobium lilium]|uniref:Damage-inducible protein n=1 Tax=Neorhizobium lilium TaxID=2503024 RepID=A0A3S3VHQ5_9HYPH|nr:ImuA family protein [Neorhizobium lilium]RWX76910.1 damage-inducible protein [Neorhizobium lilium]